MNESCERCYIVIVLLSLIYSLFSFFAFGYYWRYFEEGGSFRQQDTVQSRHTSFNVEKGTLL